MIGTSIGSRVGGLLRGGVWGLADQALLSAANFVTMLLLARHLSPADFGAFTLGYTALMFTTGLQNPLITLPHNVLGVTRHGQDYTHYTTATALSQVLFAGGAALLALGFAAAAQVAGWDMVPVVLALAPTIVAWQLQEFARRVLYTEGRSRAAFANDALSYGGQAVGIAALAQLGQLTGLTAFAVLAATSAVAALWGFWTLRSSLSRRIELRWLSGNWGFAKWLLGAALAASTYTMLYPVLVAAMLSLADVGAFRAVQTVLGPTHILLRAMHVSLTPRAARTYADGGPPALRTFLVHVGAGTAPIMGAYCLLAGILAGPLLTLLYGDRYDEFGWLLAIVALTYACAYLSALVSIGVEVMGTNGPIFRANLWSTTAALGLGAPVMHAFGLAGAALVGTGYGVLHNILLWRHFFRMQETGRAHRPARRDDYGSW